MDQSLLADVDALLERYDVMGMLRAPDTALDPIRNHWVSVYPPFDGCEAAPESMLQDWCKRPRGDIAFLYFHLPFCPRRCDFCYFDVSTDPGAAKDYLDRLVAEARPYIDRIGDDARVEHLFIGGGTPSVVPPPLIWRLIDSIRQRISGDRVGRATIEVHPRYTKKDIGSVFGLGRLNRVSIGVQTTNPGVLAAVGRESSSTARVAELCGLFRQAGAQEVNLDFMVGLHGQSITDVLSDIAFVDSLLSESLIDSVTVYPRSYSSSSRRIPYEVISPNTLQERMRMQLCYRQYFARRAEWVEYPMCFFSRRDIAAMHPSSTSRGPVAKVGFGASAYSHFDGTNFINHEGVPGYIQCVDQHGGATRRRHVLSDVESHRRRLIFGAKCGVFPAKDGALPGVLNSERQACLDGLASLGFLQREGPDIRVTDLGMLFAEHVVFKLDQLYRNLV